MSNSGYGHDDISCMTYDIHVDILLGCVFVMLPLHVHLDGKYPLYESLSTGLCSPRRGTLSGTGLVQASDPHMGPHEG